MFQQLATRQRIRKGLILLSLLLFPVILNYFSPYVIIDGMPSRASLTAV